MAFPGASQGPPRGLQGPSSSERFQRPPASQGCGPFKLLVATNSRLDSLQAKSLEPGPTKHCTRLVYTGRRNKEREFFFWRKLGTLEPTPNPNLVLSGLHSATSSRQVSQTYQGFQTNARSLQGPARAQGLPGPPSSNLATSLIRIRLHPGSAFRGNWGPRAKPKAKPSARRNWFKA